MTSANERRPRRVPGAGGEQTAGGDVTSIVRRTADSVRAFGSAFAPAPGRSRWIVTLVCPWCHLGHVHRGLDLSDIDGQTRRGGCGRRYLVVVKRRYVGERDAA